MIMPAKMLEETLNKKVALLLKDNRILEGALVGYDDYMNLVLDDAQEKSQDVNKKLGVVIVRGSNVVRIVPL
ncbi:Like-Sm ribonucleoprotein, eukaryotic and archaea-type, core [mine drainage metagenome]|uniref:Like-Sm ribonucleoprotein, eukaryotic and archaea-type, core n=1 Tax=mine drainage metagenome TaxID=410659 RepID=T1AUN2_9ZZZZ